MDYPEILDLSDPDQQVGQHLAQLVAVFGELAGLQVALDAATVDVLAGQVGIAVTVDLEEAGLSESDDVWMLDPREGADLPVPEERGHFISVDDLDRVLVIAAPDPEGGPEAALAELLDFIEGAKPFTDEVVIDRWHRGKHTSVPICASPNLPRAMRVLMPD